MRGVSAPLLILLALLSGPAARAASPDTASPPQRSVIVPALEAAPLSNSLPKDQHYLITFDTRAKGVVLPEKLFLAYPEEMTLILQYDYLVVGISEADFSLLLRFDGVDTLVVVPFNAVSRFSNPPIGLDFQWTPTAAAGDDGPKVVSWTSSERSDRLLA